jgi:hypothetical protein
MIVSRMAWKQTSRLRFLFGLRSVTLVNLIRKRAYDYGDTSDYGDTYIFPIFCEIFLCLSGAVHGADRPVCRSVSIPDPARQPARASVGLRRRLRALSRSAPLGLPARDGRGVELKAVIAHSGLAPQLRPCPVQVGSAQVVIHHAINPLLSDLRILGVPKQLILVRQGSGLRHHFVFTGLGHRTSSVARKTGRLYVYIHHRWRNP